MSIKSKFKDHVMQDVVKKSQEQLQLVSDPIFVKSRSPPCYTAMSTAYLDCFVDFHCYAPLSQVVLIGNIAFPIVRCQVNTFSANRVSQLIEVPSKLRILGILINWHIIP